MNIKATKLSKEGINVKFLYKFNAVAATDARGDLNKENVKLVHLYYILYGNNPNFKISAELGSFQFRDGVQNLRVFYVAPLHLSFYTVFKPRRCLLVRLSVEAMRISFS